MLKAIKLLLIFEKFMAKKLLNKETKQSILLRLGFLSNSKCLSQVLFFISHNSAFSVVITFLALQHFLEVIQ